MKVGILGGGQLGQMLAEAAKDLGIEPLVLDPKPDAVAAQVARHLVADYQDPDALDELTACDVVTYEFENVPTTALDRVAPRVPVRPTVSSLAISGDRFDEKTFFRELGIATAPFRPVSSRDEFDRAIAEIGLPAILKTRRFGYDGKGQAVLRVEADLDPAWERLGRQELILEGFVPFDREVSVIAVRSHDGSMRYWAPTENVHVGGILHVSRAPADEVSAALFSKARAALEALMARLDYVGVLVVEFFQIGEELVANEMACRVHNSGHWTIEGAETSQFENHVRAVAGLPLGSTALQGESAMVNLVGEIPDLSGVEDEPGIHVHVYGKSAAPGRKIGHVTIVAEDSARLEKGLARILEIVNEPTGAVD
jgi:5-(carboxyamino)imidazole ribonucleotide synthase